MEREIIVGKLDQMEIEDLDVSIDSGQMWEQLEARLNGRAYARRKLLVAACITLLILLVPFTLLQPTETLAPQAKAEPTIEVLAPKLVQEEAVTATNIFGGFVPDLLSRQGDMRVKTVAFDPSIQLANPQPAPILKAQLARNNFSNKDISVIQKNLGTSKAETVRKVTLSAQLYPSSDGSEISYQELRIRLNGKN